MSDFFDVRLSNDLFTDIFSLYIGVSLICLTPVASDCLLIFFTPENLSLKWLIKFS